MRPLHLCPCRWRHRARSRRACGWSGPFVSTKALKGAGVRGRAVLEAEVAVGEGGGGIRPIVLPERFEIGLRPRPLARQPQARRVLQGLFPRGGILVRSPPARRRTVKSPPPERPSSGESSALRTTGSSSSPPL